MTEPIRDQTISVRLTAVEHQEIVQAAKMSGETASAWCRDVILRLARGKRVEVSTDKLEWLRDAIAGLAKLNTEVLRTLLEHTEHESPALELRRREAAERKLKVALQKLGLDGSP